MRSGLVAVSVVSWLTSCATVGGTGGPQAFPTRADVQAVAERTVKLDLTRLDAVAVDSWTLEGPFPTHAQVEEVPPRTDWELALAKAAPGLFASLSTELQCVARECARFAAERGSFPGSSLKTFIERRCGSTVVDTHLESLSGEVPASVSDAELLIRWGPSLERVAKASKPEALAGLAVHRSGDRAALVLVTGTPEARFTRPIALVPGPTVEVRGRLTFRGAERVQALINTGAAGVSTCKPLDALSPPDFAFECPVQAADVSTTLSIASFDKDRLLGHGVGSFRLWPAGTPASTWRAPGGTAEVEPDQFNAAFLARVNDLRADSGLMPLTEVPAQSATAASLAPHYFASQLDGGDPGEADRIAQGLMAGWDVDVTLVSSGFGSEWVSGSRDLSVFLEAVLDDPFTRHALTEPRARLASVGLLPGAGPSLAALFATYVPLGTFDRKEAEVAVVSRLNRLRQERNLGIAQWTLWPADEGAVIERRLAANDWDERQALDHALEKTAALSRGRVVGYVQLVDDLEHFQFPPAVLLRPQVNVFVAVGVYRARDWAQARYVVCFVLAQGGDVEVAAR